MTIAVISGLTEMYLRIHPGQPLMEHETRANKDHGPFCPSMEHFLPTQGTPYPSGSGHKSTRALALHQSCPLGNEKAPNSSSSLTFSVD